MILRGEGRSHAFVAGCRVRNSVQRPIAIPVEPNSGTKVAITLQRVQAALTASETTYGAAALSGLAPKIVIFLTGPN